MATFQRSLHELGPGARVGHFTIEKAIGAGGMGLIFEARDLKLGRPVALKILPRDLFHDENARARFLREAQLAASISHPNIATIHEVDEADGTLFIAMELVPGTNLKQILSEGPLPPEEVASLGVQACNALEAAHQRSVIHRDVKSSNIMLTPSGQLKMLDFGLAKPFSESRVAFDSLPTREWRGGESSSTGKTSSTATGVAVGTPPYMSPEQASGEVLDERTDLFSLGVVLYEAATGTLPFRGSNASEILSSVRHVEPAPLHKVRPEIPVSLSKVVSGCLEKNREQRYQSAAALRADLLGVERSSLTRLLLKGADRARKRPAAASAIALAVLLGIALGLAAIAGNPTPTRLAVLPFVNLSDQGDADAMAEGMTEQLVTRLSYIPSLRVISRRSAAQFDDSGTPLGEISTRLGGVELFVTGTVLTASGEVRVTIELSDETGANRLARTYQRPLTNVLKLQEELAREIASVLELELGSAHEGGPTEAAAVNEDAYRLYVRGRNYWNRRTDDAYRASIDHFRKAIAIQPDFALAHAGLADAELLLGPPSGERTRRAYQATKEAATRALELDPDLGQARAALAFAEYFLGGNWEEAERQFQLALELSPSYATAHHWYADYLVAMGRFEEAFDQISLARELDPGSIAIMRDRAWSPFLSGRYRDAASLLEETLDVDPTFVPARTLLARCYARLGRTDEAVAIIEDLRESFGPVGIVELLAETHALAGRSREAREILAPVVAEPERHPAWPYGVALVYVALGEKDSAIDWLWRAHAANDRTLVNLNVDARFEPLENEPRFIELIEKMGFPHPRRS